MASPETLNYCQLCKHVYDGSCMHSAIKKMDDWIHASMGPEHEGLTYVNVIVNIGWVEGGLCEKRKVIHRRHLT